MKNALSILKANRLYLLTMLLIIIIGSFIQFYSLGWGLIGTEILLIFLPAYIYLKRNKVNMRKSLRLRWPRLAGRPAQYFDGFFHLVLGCLY